MPWQASGVFLRETPVASGENSWQLEQAGGYKIIDEHHDFHDQDLADGIEACLNLDGYNAMRADLDMGSNTITNLVNGTAAGDVATVGQTVRTASFDTGTRILTLGKTGEADLTVSIPGVTSGGSVLEVDGVAGQTVTNPASGIVTTGSIGLATVISPTTLSGIITNITVDAYGRVTAVASTAGALNTDLSYIESGTTIRVDSSTGDNVLLPTASFFENGILSKTDWSAFNGKREPRAAGPGALWDIEYNSNIQEAGFIKFDGATPAATGVLRLNYDGYLNSDDSSVTDFQDFVDDITIGDQIMVIAYGNPSEWVRYNITNIVAGTGGQNLTVGSLRGPGITSTPRCEVRLIPA